MNPLDLPVEVEPLLPVLHDARDLGFLGPRAVEDQLRHSVAFGEVANIVRPAPGGLTRGTPARFVDLGSGGGIPGLVMAVLFPLSHVVLVESMARRARFLVSAVERLGLSERVTVAQERAESAGRAPSHRETAWVVTARSFAPPAVTAECAAGFLRVGGTLVVAEPPTGTALRWPESSLAELGFDAARTVPAHGYHFVAILKIRSDPKWPRRAGIPQKRPRWQVPRPSSQAVADSGSPPRRP